MKKLFALCILSLFMVACSGLEIINDPPLRVTTGSNVNAFTKSTSINKYEYCATETGIDDGGWTVLKKKAISYLLGALM